MDEAKLFNDGIATLRQRLKSEKNLAEKQALLFYIDELKKLIPCPEDEQFRKPERGIGGSGDKIVFQKLICRNSEGIPIFDNNKPKVKTCVFDNIGTYIDFVSNNKNPQKKIAQFYNGMSLDEYIVLTQMTYSKQHRFY